MIKVLRQLSRLIEYPTIMMPKPPRSYDLRGPDELENYKHYRLARAKCKIYMREHNLLKPMIHSKAQ